MDIVRDMADLQYVNQRLLQNGLSQIEFGSVVAHRAQSDTSIAKSPASSNPDVRNADTLECSEFSSFFEITVPESPNWVSPDSDILCQSPDCPIVGIQHNLGRYFHNGQRPGPISTLAFEDIIVGSAEDIDNTFNHTVPPPEIVTSYIRICVGLHDRTDLHMVRQYKKHHMWSPIVSEPVTPWPRDVFPSMHGLYGQVMPSSADDDHRQSVASQLGGISVQAIDGSGAVGLFDSDLTRRPLRATDFEDSDSDDDGDDGDDDENRASLHYPNLGQGAAVEFHTIKDCAPIRAMPQGRHLVTERLRLQQKILREMAHYQRQDQTQADGGCGLCSSFCTNSETTDFETHGGTSDEDDYSLEILLELLEVLPKIRQDGNLQSIFRDDSHGRSGFSNSEFAILLDAEIMLRKAFADVVSGAERTYQPTGLPVTLAQLRTELALVISTRQYMLAQNPGESIGDIIGRLSRDGKGLLDW